MDSCIPLRTVKQHPNDKPWITPAIREFIKKRQQAWLNDDLPLYKVYRNKVIKLCKKARHKFYNDKINNIHESTRVKTHKLSQVCKQVVTSLFTSCQQVVFALLVPSLL